ncbi:MAG: hypothetical protein ABF384_04655 [Verrucomicrobiales bacterium]
MKTLSILIMAALLIAISGCSKKGEAKHFGVEKFNGINWVGIELLDGEGSLTAIVIVETTVQGVWEGPDNITIRGRKITIPSDMNLIIAQEGDDVRFYKMESKDFQRKPRDIEMFAPYLKAK